MKNDKIISNFVCCTFVCEMISLGAFCTGSLAIYPWPLQVSALGIEKTNAKHPKRTSEPCCKIAVPSQAPFIMGVSSYGEHLQSGFWDGAIL